MKYHEFLDAKMHEGADYGFDDDDLPDFLFPFQRDITGWALRKGRAAIFADCGLGKTAMQLVWADRVVRNTNGRVLIVTPLAVSFQTQEEAQKFGIDAVRSHAGELPAKIVITNYERLHFFNPSDFVAMVCDESSILKSYNGARKADITNFMRKLPYRLLCTATAAPNDYIELGTSSEALGYLGHMDMLNRFFKNDQNNSSTGRVYGEQVKWRFKGHAELAFWRWVVSWARAIRKPSDIGHDDDGFNLPALNFEQHMVDVDMPADGMLFHLPAVGLKEQREESKRTIQERCERVSELVSDTGEPALVWCHRNAEGDLLDQMIPDAIQVSGADSDDAKEGKFIDFSQGRARVLVTKPKIGAWGLNFQHCAHVTYFPNHSYEGFYQAVRRCWRFGQTRQVKVDIVLTEGERKIMENMDRKASQAEEMFGRLVSEMHNALEIKREAPFKNTEEMPAWL